MVFGVFQKPWNFEKIPVCGGTTSAPTSHDVPLLLAWLRHACDHVATTAGPCTAALLLAVVPVLAGAITMLIADRSVNTNLEHAGHGQ